MKPTQERLKELLRYDRETGIFTWLKSNNNYVKPGDVAGWPRKGYTDICVDGVGYRAHCLAWLYMTGAWPAVEVDHKNGIKSDNRWNNLRETTHAVNMQNLRAPSKRNTTGFLGVSRWKEKFKADIRVNGRTKYLGLFETPELAHAAYLLAKRKHHEGCTI